MKLNLGCSDRLKPGYVNVDSFRPANADDSFQQVDLEHYNTDLIRYDKWPWQSSSVEEIVADDIIEHLHNKIRTMNEIHRVLMPGGLAHIFVPTTDGRGAWQDPTHVSYWNRNSFWYYTKGVAEYERFHTSYGITACFTVVKEEMTIYPGDVHKLTITLEAVK